MLASALKSDVERHADTSRTSNPFLKRAEMGSLNLQSVAVYIVSVGHLTKQTLPHLRLAEEQAFAQGRPALARFFAKKRTEEVGHERWATHDASVLMRHLDLTNVEPVPAAFELQKQIETAIRGDVRLYLAYIFFAEYITVLVGGELVKYLTSRCEVPADGLTSISNHVTLDAEHVGEALMELDTLVPEGDMVEPMREAMRGFMTGFDRLCEDVVHEPSARSGPM